MKKLFFLILMAFAGICLNAQTNLDSLLGIWNNKTKADTIRLEAMNIFLHGGPNKEFSGNDLFGKNPDSALVLVKMMDTFAKTKGNKKYQLHALHLHGAYFQTIKNFKEALNSYGQALKMAREIQNPKLIISSLISIGNGRFAWGLSTGMPDTLHLAQAEKYFQEALGLIEGKSLKSNEVPSNLDPQMANYGAFAYRGLGLLNLVQSKYSTARANFEKSIFLAAEGNDENVLEDCMGYLGVTLGAERNYPAAIKYYTKSLALAEQKEDKHWIAHNLQNLGDLYTKVGEYAKAEDYLTRALASIQAAGAIHNREQLGMMLGLHDCFILQKNYSKAFVNDSIFLKLAKEIWPPFEATGLAMLSQDYYEMGNYTKALEYGFLGLKKNEEVSVDPNILNLLSVQIGNSYRMQGQYSKAITWCEKANLDGSAEVKKGACECLYESHKALNHGKEALAYHEKFLFWKDSLNTQELSRNLQQMEFTKQVLQDSLATAEKERLVQESFNEEVRQKNQTRNLLIATSIIILIFAGGIFGRLRYVRKSKAILQTEKDRSDNLLLNILPEEIAAELKEKGKADARDFEMVSILFTDFKGFTKKSETLSAVELVNEINQCFKAFDDIMGKYNIEKIKTIGDAYMAAGGLPVPSDDSVKNTVLAALEMQVFISQRKIDNDAKGKPAFEMRAGIHTGPIVAGIVGVKKFQYDIWGDTVNTASRLETGGEIGKVNISQKTYELLKDDPEFSFESRGKIEAKGKGEINMWFVSLNTKKE